MQNDLVSKDQVFKLRLGDEDRKCLDDLAQHFSAPAATVVRMLIKDKHRTLPQKAPSAEPDPLETAVSDDLSRYTDVLTEIAEHDADETPLEVPDLAVALNAGGWEARMPWLARVLNELRRAGYIRRMKTDTGTQGYRLDDKGKAWAAKK